MNPICFISHINEESQFAKKIKEILQRCFPNGIDVFISSDPESLERGDFNIDTIAKMLRECSVALILVSPQSVNRNWINIETGAIWMRKLMGEQIAAIPVCHSGYTVNDLQPPMSLLQGVNLSDKYHFKELLDRIKKIVGRDNIENINIDIDLKCLKDMEIKYSFWDYFREAIRIAGYDPDDVVDKIKTSKTKDLVLQSRDLPASQFEKLDKYIKNKNIDNIVKIKGDGMYAKQDSRDVMTWHQKITIVVNIENIPLQK